MDRRGALIDRLVSWSPVFLLGGLAALTYWLDAQVQADTARRDGTARHDADMYIENFRAVSFDAEGKLRQSLAAQRAEHHPDDESVDFIAPSLALTDPGRPRMAITADAGTLTGDRETVTFRGNVRATRDALPEGTAAGGTGEGNEPRGPITMTSETLRVIPKKGRAETDGPVTVEEPRGIIHSVGMAVDNEAHTIKLKSGVHGTLSPEIAPK
jgi:lipopolysaccharide export system protein LptC